MAIYQIDWYSFRAAGRGYQSFEVNIPPAWVIAQVNLHGHLGGGLTYTGIKSYRRRLSSGADENVDFGGWLSWPPIVFDYISSVTFGVANGAHQVGYVSARMDYWS